MRPGSIIEHSVRLSERTTRILRGVVFESDEETVSVRFFNGELRTLPVSDVEDVTPSLFVNVYLWDRGYGGPEEGGWYFDSYVPDPDRCKQFHLRCDAERYLDEMQKWCNEENLERRHPSSVLSEGHYVVHMESWPAEVFPQSKPQYE